MVFDGVAGRVNPSNQVAQRESRCPLTRISKRPASPAVDMSLISLPCAVTNPADLQIW